MGQHAGLVWSEIARAGALAMGCLALAHCSGPLGNRELNPRVVEEGEPVPKGGGLYRVGKPYNINGKTYVPAENPHYRAEGVASWYGRDFHGRLTANGEIYDMYSLSAAHTTLPLPSYVRVTNLDNHRSIVVRVNDRGPYHRNRVIDLSIGTAKALEFYDRGLARVRVEYVGPAPIEGSDDTMLMATLREDGPAPAPSKVMVAAAKPFIPEATRANEAPLPPERPSFALASASSRPAKAASGGESRSPTAGSTAVASSSSGKAKTSAQPAYASAAEPEPPPPPAATAPAVGFAPQPPRAEASFFGFISGRGLY